MLDFGATLEEDDPFYGFLQKNASSQPEELPLEIAGPKFHSLMRVSRGFLPLLDYKRMKALSLKFSRKGVGTMPLKMLFDDLEQYFRQRIDFPEGFLVSEGDELLLMSDFFTLVGCFYELTKKKRKELEKSKGWCESLGVKTLEEAFTKITLDSLNQ